MYSPDVLSVKSFQAYIYFSSKLENSGRQHNQCRCMQLQWIIVKYFSNLSLLYLLFNQFTVRVCAGPHANHFDNYNNANKIHSIVQFKNEKLQISQFEGVKDVRIFVKTISCLLRTLLIHQWQQHTGARVDVF